MTEREVEDIFFLDSGPLVPKTDTVKARDPSRIRDFSQENMFSFFLDKQTQLEGHNHLQQDIRRLTSLARGADSSFGFLFSADPKCSATQSRFLSQLVSPTRSYDPFSKPTGLALHLTGARASPDTSGLMAQQASAVRQSSGRMQEESPEKSEEAIFQRLVMSKADYAKYKQPSFWEDINNKRRVDVPVKGHGLITPSREEDFVRYMQKHYVSMWNPQPVQVAFKQYRKNIDLLLMSVESSLFSLDKSNGLFFVVNKGISTDRVSGSSPSSQKKP